MKRIKLNYLLLLMMALCTIFAKAHDFELDGIYYFIIKGTAEASVTYRGTYPMQYSNNYSGFVTIPASVTYNGTTFTVTSISDWAFDNCSLLSSVSIPNSVTSIGDNAFSYCTGLTNVSIPNSVTSIGSSAFSYCSSLLSVSIPNSVALIRGNAFSGCSELTSITVESDNQNYDSRDNCNAIIETASNTLITGCKNTTIPNSITSIGAGAFNRCIGLTRVSIPNSVISIRGNAFSYCSGLTNIIVESGNHNYDSRDNCNAIIETTSNTLIVGCKSTTIPNSITTIGSSAFAGCSELTSINIPNFVTTIGSSAFERCTDLSNIDMGDSVTSIGSCAFYGCTAIPSITIPNSVTTISSDAFSGCTNLVDITIPSSVINIGGYAFHNTAWYNNQPNGLVYAGSVAYSYKGTMPSGTSIELRDGTLSIAGCAFQGCTGLTKLTIPNSVISICECAFQGCTGLLNMSLSDSIIFIGYDAFDNTAWYNTQPNGLVYAGSVVYSYKGTMPSGTSIELRDGTLGIADFAFRYCAQLVKVTIPKSVFYIGSYAFQGCSSLINVTIPNSVISIGYDAFGGCTSINSVTCLPTTPPSSYNGTTFSEVVYNNAVLYVPMNSINDYRSSVVWKYFKNIVGININTGDINNDNEINIADINAVIDLILSGESDSIGDANSDGEVNIADINVLVDTILNK